MDGRGATTAPPPLLTLRGPATEAGPVGVSARPAGPPRRGDEGRPSLGIGLRTYSPTVARWD